MKDFDQDIKIILLDNDYEYGKAISEFFLSCFRNKEKISFEYFSTLELLGESLKFEPEFYNLEARKPDMVILYEQAFSEREIRLILDDFLFSSNSVLLAEMGRSIGDKMYKYGRPSDLLRDVIELIDEKFSKPECVNEALSENIVSSRQLIYAGVGFSGGIGTSTFLIRLYNSLTMKGFKVLYCDLSFWSKSPPVNDVDQYPDLSFFSLMKEKSDCGLRAVMENVLSKSPDGESVIIKASTEPDSLTEVSGNNIKELIKELIELEMFDFVLLDMSRVHLVDMISRNFNVNGMFFVRGEFEEVEDSNNESYTLCKDSISKLFSCFVHEIVIRRSFEKIEPTDLRIKSKDSLLKSKKTNKKSAFFSGDLKIKKHEEDRSENDRLVNNHTERILKEWSEYAGNLREN